MLHNFSPYEPTILIKAKIISLRFIWLIMNETQKEYYIKLWTKTRSNNFHLDSNLLYQNDTWLFEFEQIKIKDFLRVQ